MLALTDNKQDNPTGADVNERTQLFIIAQTYTLNVVSATYYSTANTSLLHVDDRMPAINTYAALSVYVNTYYLGMYSDYPELSEELYTIYLDCIEVNSDLITYGLDHTDVTVPLFYEYNAYDAEAFKEEDYALYFYAREYPNKINLKNIKRKILRFA